MENFTNSIILPNNLPVVEPSDFNKIEKRYLKIIYIRISIFLFLIIAGFIAFLLIPDEEIPVLTIILVILAIILFFATLFIVSTLGFPKKGYLLREKDISYKKGLIFFSQITVPFNRIQHVEVSQGILAKMFKLWTLKIFTAGGSSSDFSIPGLSTGIAHKLKEYISEKIGTHE